MEIVFNDNLVTLDVEGDSRDEILLNIATNIVKQGYAHVTFPEAIIDRENRFSTGLETIECGVAIPHTDIEHVKKNCISVAKLKNPVEFVVMGEVDKKVKVEIIFMLAIKEAHTQIQLLMNIMSILQDKEILANIRKAKSKEDITNILKNKF